MPPWSPSVPRACAALVLAALSACGPAPRDAGPRSAVLITLDTTRADALSCYGAPAGTTPVLDGLAREGVLFRNARATAPLTLPSHASMLTGLYPPRHGLRNNGLGALPSAAETVAERARAAGLRTGAFVGAVVLDDAFGLDQGFERYDSPERSVGARSKDYAERPAAEVVDAALAWLNELEPERPFFLWVHLFDPHGPYEPPPEHAHHASPYLGEVAYADAQIGRLLDGLRERRGTLPFVLVAGDHGEALGEHDEPTHGTLCYDATIRVPLVLRDPGEGGAGAEVDAPVSVADVHPTLLDAMRLGAAEGVDGVSLHGREPPADRGVYFESYYGYYAYGWSPLTGWADRDGKYVHGSRPELFAIGEDAQERNDLAEQRPDERARYLARLRALAAEPALAPDAAAATDPELAARIRSLGYAGGDEPGGQLPGIADDHAGLRSPREGAAEHREVMRAQRLMNQRGDHAAAERVLRAVLERNPRNFTALDELGRCLMLQDRHDEAARALARVLTEGPSWPQTLVNLGLCLVEEGRDEEALVYLLRALEVDANDAKALGSTAILLERMGRDAEAAPYRERFRKLTGGELPRER